MTTFFLRASNSRHFVSILIFGLLFIASLLIISLNTIAKENIATKNLDLTLLHSNDLHSHEDSFIERGKNIGGIARIASIIKAEKNSSKNVLAVDAGDIFQGTPFFEQYHGQTDIECLNKSLYDIFTLGNHEFDEGPANLAKQLALAKFDIINCNLNTDAHPALSQLIKPSVIKIIDGQRVAFVGAITPQLNLLSNTLDGVKLKASGEAWMEPIKNAIAKLKNEGINKIIVVSHIGVEQEQALAQAIPDIDIIIGGHSHTRLEKPIIIKHPDKSICLIVQTGCYARALGKLNLVFDQEGQILLPESRYRLINLSQNIKPDPEVEAYIEEMGKPFAKLKQIIVAKSLSNFDNKFKSYSCDSALGNLICDSLLFAASNEGATISLQNRGGIRGRIEPGLINMEKVKEILPFPNHLVIATITGNELLTALENSVSGLTGGKFLDVSGLVFAYDPEAKIGEKIVFAGVKNKDNVFNEIERNKDYRIAINNYSFNGGEGYDFSKARNIKIINIRLSDLFAQYLQSKKEIKAQIPNRIVAVSNNNKLFSQENNSIKINSPENKLSEVSIFANTNLGASYLDNIGSLPIDSPVFIQKIDLLKKKNKIISLSTIKKQFRQKAHLNYTPKQIYLCAITKSKITKSTYQKIVTAPILVDLTTAKN